MLRFRLLLLLRGKGFSIARRFSVNDFTLRTHTCGELRVGHESSFILFYFSKPGFALSPEFLSKHIGYLYFRVSFPLI